MMLMPANHSSSLIHYLAGKHPGKLGWLVGPSARMKTTLRPWMPYALDNDAFSAWSKNKEWDEQAWRALLIWAKDSGLHPRWVLVPDVVADKEKTLERWGVFAPHAKSFGWPVAFAVQDGMTVHDVPEDADVIFIGGTYEWKWSVAALFAWTFPRVHIGRVNELDRLWQAQDLGVESVDGTGWFRDPSNPKKLPNMIKWLEGKRA